MLSSSAAMWGLPEDVDQFTSHLSQQTGKTPAGWGRGAVGADARVPQRAVALISSVVPVAAGTTLDAPNLPTHVAHEHTNAVNRSFSDLDVAKFALASAVLCAARTAVQHPLTLALTRKQTCAEAARMSTIDILRRIHCREGGLRSLTQGMSAMVAGCAISEAVYLVLIEGLREYLPLESEFARDAGAAYAADATSRFIFLPMSIVAFRQMTQYPFTAPTSPKIGADNRVVRSSAAKVLRGMYNEGGLRSVFCGLGVTLAVGSQYSALWWATYIKVKELSYGVASPFLQPHDPTRWTNIFTSQDDNVAINTAASVSTSAVTSVLFNPFFVLRVNMQCAVKGTVVGTARALYRKGGWRAFYQGTYLNMVASVVDGVLASTSYEYAKILADRSKV